MRHVLTLISISLLSFSAPVVHASQSSGPGAGKRTQPTTAAVQRPAVHQDAGRTAAGSQTLRPQSTARPAINPQPLPPRTSPGSHQ